MSINGIDECHECDIKTLRIAELEAQAIETKNLLEAAFSTKASLFTGVQAIQAVLRVLRLK